MCTDDLAVVKCVPMNAIVEDGTPRVVVAFGATVAFNAEKNEMMEGVEELSGVLHRCYAAYCESIGFRDDDNIERACREITDAVVQRRRERHALLLASQPSGGVVGRGGCGAPYGRDGGLPQQTAADHYIFLPLPLLCPPKAGTAEEQFADDESGGEDEFDEEALRGFDEGVRMLMRRYGKQKRWAKKYENPKVELAESVVFPSELHTGTIETGPESRALVVGDLHVYDTEYLGWARACAAVFREIDVSGKEEEEEGGDEEEE